jgi:hypothetical protein
MWKLALLLVVLSACGKEEKPKLVAPERAQPDERKPVEPKPAPPTTPDEPPDEAPAAPPEEPSEPVAGGGQCTVLASVGRDFKQVSGGGPSAANVFQWQTPETRKQKGYKDEGFILNCNGSDIRLSIATSPTAAVPFGAKQYKIGEDNSPVRITGTMGNTSIAKASGMLSVEKFDDKRLAGRLTLYINSTVPPTDMFKLIADFDFSCNGLSGCK